MYPPNFAAYFGKSHSLQDITFFLNALLVIPDLDEYNVENIRDDSERFKRFCLRHVSAAGRRHHHSPPPVPFSLHKSLNSTMFKDYWTPLFEVRMAGLHANDTLPFKNIESCLKLFSEINGGKFFTQAGFSAEEIRYCKSEFSKLVDAWVLSPVLKTLGQSFTQDSVRKQSEQLILNAYADLAYKNQTIRFHARNTGFGVQSSNLRITYAIEPKHDFRLIAKRRLKENKSHQPYDASKLRVRAIPCYLRVFFPIGLLNAYERDIGASFPVSFDVDGLDSIFIFRVSVPPETW